MEQALSYIRSIGGKIVGKGGGGFLVRCTRSGRVSYMFVGPYYPAGSMDCCPAWSFTIQESLGRELEQYPERIAAAYREMRLKYGQGTPAERFALSR